MSNFSFPLNLNSYPVINLSPPHGFLVWRGKQTVIAGSNPYPAGQPVYIVSGGEAFGLATLGQPAQMAISEFEREVHAEKHKIRPEERKRLWPEAMALYTQEIKELQPFDSPKQIVDGLILEDSHTPEEAAIIEVSKRLPKFITLHPSAVCLTDLGFTATREAQSSKELANILEAVYERAVKFNGDGGNVALPLYNLALVRPPTMRFDKILSRILSAEKAHSGVMVAFMLPPQYTKQLAIFLEVLPESCQIVPANELHLTLAYLGNAVDLEGQRKAIKETLTVLAEETLELIGRIGGFGRFLTNEADGTNAIYASFDAPELPAFRQKLVERLAGAGLDVANNHGFTPHITLCYLPADATTPDLIVPPLEMTLPNLTLGWGGVYTDFHLGGQKQNVIDQITEAGGVEDEILAIYAPQDDTGNYFVVTGDWATVETIQA
ncbi:MAG: 2'-5' RNA ligase family protein, partial [Nitrospiria bacterium]